MRLKKTSDMELMRIIADNQQFIESNMDKPELIYSVLIDKIPKKKYTYISPKKRKKKEYDLEFLKLLAKDLNESTKNCESYYDMLVELIYSKMKESNFIQNMEWNYHQLKKNWVM